MNTEEFNQRLERRIELTRQILGFKANEYATDDRLYNFKRAAEFQRIDPMQVCWNYLMKHLTSLQDMVERCHGGYFYPGDKWDEKIGDAINYLILLEMLAFEGKTAPPSVGSEK